MKLFYAISLCGVVLSACSTVEPTYIDPLYVATYNDTINRIHAQEQVMTSTSNNAEITIKSLDSLVEMTKIRERQKTARAYSLHPDTNTTQEVSSSNCNNLKLSQNPFHDTTDNKYKRLNIPNQDNELLLEGMDLLASNMEKLLEIQSDCKSSSKLTEHSGITINGNGSDGMVVNVNSAGSDVKRDTITTIPTIKNKKNNNKRYIIPKFNPPAPAKSPFTAFWDGLFGSVDNTVNAVGNFVNKNAGVIGLTIVGSKVADRETTYIDNNDRQEVYDFSDNSDHSINTEAPIEE